MSQLSLDIETLYAEVNQTANSIGYEIRDNIQPAWNYFKQLQYPRLSGWFAIYDLADHLFEVQAYLQNSLPTYFDNIESRLYDIDIALSQLFNSNLWPVILKITQAVDEATGNTDIIMGQVQSVVNAAKSDLEAQLAKEVNILNERIRVDTSGIESDLRAELEFLEDDIYEISATINSTLEPEISSLWNSITDTASTIYTWAESQVQKIMATIDTTVTNVITWTTKQYNAALEAVEGAMAYLSGVIDSKITSLKNWVYSEFNIIKGLINDIYDKATKAITVAVNELKGIYDSLAQLIDWRFVFLKLFMSYPELSFLQVINRDEATFQRFKPYWQAFLVRVLMP